MLLAFRIHHPDEIGDTRMIARRALTVGLILLGAAAVEAADITVKATIKSIDSTQSSITIQRKSKTLDLELSDNVRILIDGKSADLSSLKKGAEASVTFNSTLEIVTKIVVGDEPKTLKPTISVISELDGRGQESHPWLSSDGLTIYWTSSNPRQNVPWINMAKRGDNSSLFGEPSELIPAMDFSLSDDQLEIIMFLDRSLHQSTRNSVKDRFGRLTRLNLSLRGGFLAGPCLSRDGLRLYCDGVIKGRGSQIHVSERKTKNSPWSNPIPLRLPYRGVVKYPFISDDELHLFCTAKDINRGSNILVFSRKDKNSEFDSVGVVELDNAVVRGIFPRYCAKTNELVFSNDDMKLMLVRDFDPTMMVKPLR